MPWRPPYLRIAAVPVAGYLSLLVLVAVLVDPPLLGWIGLAVVCAVGLSLTIAAAVLFPRMKVNVAAEGARTGGGILVVADATCGSERLCEAVGAHVAGRGLPVHVVAPVLVSPLHYLSGEDEDELRAAHERLRATVGQLTAAGIAAEGTIGVDDPAQAIGDALASFPAGEIMIVTAAETHWLEGDLLAWAATLVDQVDHVVVAEEPVAV